MNKLIYVLWPSRPMERRARRDALLDVAAPALIARGARGVQVNVEDDDVHIGSPAPRLPLSDEPFVASVCLYVDDGADPRAFADVLRAAGFDVAGYRVDEHLYTEYGENPHAARRTWPDGVRSPGVTAITLLERPAHIPKDEWMRRWFGRQSPMSEWMQPRSRYVRNVVVEVLTEGAFPYEGIVEEAWPSERHVTDLGLFYGARTPLEIAKNMTTMLRSVTNFLPITRIPNVLTSEYFVKSDFGARGVTSPLDR